MLCKVLNCEDLGHFLEAKGVHKDVVSTFATTCGRHFLALTEDGLKELVPIIGDRVYIRKLLQSKHKVMFYMVD